MTYGCIKFIDSYRFLSNSLDKLVGTLADNIHRTFENLKNEIVFDDNIINFVDEIKKLLDKDDNDRTIEDLEKDSPNAIEKLEEALMKYMGEKKS